MAIGSVGRGETRNDPTLDYRGYTFIKKGRRHTSPVKSPSPSRVRESGAIGAIKTKPTVSTNK